MSLKWGLKLLTVSDQTQPCIMKCLVDTLLMLTEFLQFHSKQNVGCTLCLCPLNFCNFTLKRRSFDNVLYWEWGTVSSKKEVHTADSECQYSKYGSHGSTFKQVQAQETTKASIGRTINKAETSDAQLSVSASGPQLETVSTAIPSGSSLIFFQLFEHFGSSLMRAYQGLLDQIHKQTYQSQSNIFSKLDLSGHIVWRSWINYFLMFETSATWRNLLSRLRV